MTPRHRHLAASLLALALSAAACESRVSLGGRCTTDSECGTLRCRFGRCRAECTSASDCADPAAFCIGTAGAGVCTVPTVDRCTSECGADGLVCVEGTCTTPCEADGCLPGSSCQPVSGATVCVAIPRVDGGLMDASLEDASLEDASLEDASLEDASRVDASRVDADLDAGPLTRTARRLCVGDNHACVVRDGAVLCWGFNQVGQIGDGSNTLTVGPRAHRACLGMDGVTYDCALSPERVQLHAAGAPLDGVVELSCGAAHTCAIDASGAAYCWGASGDSGLGHLHTGWAAEPVVGLTDFHADSIRGGRFHTCVREDATASWRCWGQNATLGMVDDRLGTGDTSVDLATSAIASPALDGARELAGGGFFTCAALSDGTVSCRGRNDGAVVDALDDGGLPRIVPGGAPLPGVLGPTSLAAGAAYGCVLVSGVVSCWGSNAVRQLGADAPACPGPFTPFSSCRHDAQPIDDASHRRFVARWSSAGITETGCAITEAREVVCWGNNHAGLAGADAAIERVTVPGAPVAGVADALEVAVGGVSACALEGDGEVRCWGANDLGQLGCGGLDTDPHASSLCAITFPGP
ncbi:MAG: hypothetical protein K1X94_06120 [Sandaracinaceae bacterium]|nr:hypothetical protein [Sandaracinaceae bacterium]